MKNGVEPILVCMLEKAPHRLIHTLGSISEGVVGLFTPIPLVRGSAVCFIGKLTPKYRRVRVFSTRRREIHTSTHSADPSSIIFAILRLTRWYLYFWAGQNKEWNGNFGTGCRRTIWTP